MAAMTKPGTGPCCCCCSSPASCFLTGAAASFGLVPKLFLRPSDTELGSEERLSPPVKTNTEEETFSNGDDSERASRGEIGRALFEAQGDLGGSCGEEGSVLSRALCSMGAAHSAAFADEEAAGDGGDRLVPLGHGRGTAVGVGEEGRGGGTAAFGSIGCDAVGDGSEVCRGEGAKNRGLAWVAGARTAVISLAGI